MQGGSLSPHPLQHLLSVDLLMMATLVPYCSFFVFLFSGPHMQHMEVPRLGVKSELQLPAYTIAIAGSEPHQRSTPQLKQCQILKSLSEARDQTSNLMVPSWIYFRCATTRTPMLSIFLCAYWPSVYLLWRNVYLGFLPIFQLDYFFC